MIRLVDYIKKCLRNQEFREVWNKIYDGNLNLNTNESILEYTNQELWEYLNNLNESDLDDVIKNKGINAHASTDMDIQFYECDGKCPVAEFLQEMSNQELKAKTILNIYQLSKLGSTARPPLSNYVEDGILELRAKSGSNIDRIFYFFIAGNKIIMTNGYIKKTQKLDKSELKKAKQYRDEYMRRN